MCFEKDIEKYKWSSYNEYVNCSKLSHTDYVLSTYNEDRKKAIELFIKHMHEFNDDKCLEIEEKRRISDDEAKTIIKKICKMTNPSEFQRLNIETRNKIIKKIKESGLSIRQIERLTGINRGIVLKA